MRGVLAVVMAASIGLNIFLLGRIRKMRRKVEGLIKSIQVTGRDWD